MEDPTMVYLEMRKEITLKKKRRPKQMINMLLAVKIFHFQRFTYAVALYKSSIPCNRFNASFAGSNKNNISIVILSCTSHAQLAINISYHIGKLLHMLWINSFSLYYLLQHVNFRLRVVQFQPHITPLLLELTYFY